MHHRRSLSVLVATTLALALGTSTALGAVPESQKGKIGTFSIPDSNAEPGVACTYGAICGPGDGLDQGCCEGGLRCRGNTWFLPYETIQSRDRERPHPATFPEQLPEDCLRLHGLRRIRRVLDPFLGLGSTAVACARLGLPFDGVELDEEYLGVAVRRAREALG